MTEEEKQDEPLEEFPENPEEVKETPKPTETVEPTRFDGLSKEELLKIVKDQDSYVGEKNQEIGDLKKRMDEFETSQPRQEQGFGDYGQQPQAPVTPPPTEPEEAPVKPKFDWDNPSSYVDEAVNRGLEVKEKQVLQAQFNQNLHRAQTAFEQGKRVMTKHPTVFNGIEKEVEKQVGEFYYPYLQQGQPVDQYLTDEDMWLKTAQHIRLNRGEFDKLKPDVSSAVKPTVTETPSQTTKTDSGSPVIELEPVDRVFAKNMGLTDKEAKENIEYELKARKENVS